MNDLENDLRTMLATRAADPVPRPDTYERVRGRIATHRHRRTAAAGAATALALAAAFAVVQVRVAGRSTGFAASDAAFVTWPARGDLRSDRDLVERAVRTWEAADQDRRRDKVRLLWAGPVSGRQTVLFEATDRRDAAHLVLVTRYGDAASVDADVPAPGRDVAFVAVVTAPPRQTPQQVWRGVATVLPAPDATYTGMRSDEGEWTPIGGGALAGDLSLAAGRFSVATSVEVTVDRDTGAVTGPPSGVVTDAEPTVHAGPNRSDGSVVELGWSNRNYTRDVPQDRRNALADRLVGALVASQELPEGVPVIVYWQGALPDGTEVVLGTFHAGDEPTRMLLYTEPDPASGAVVVSAPLTLERVVRQVSAVVETRTGRKLLVLGSPLVSAIRYLPSDGEPVTVPVRDGWGLLPVGRAATAADRVEVTDVDGTWQDNVTFRD
jgi:hypothetical protein